MDSRETFCIIAIKCQTVDHIPVITGIGGLNQIIHLESSSIHDIDDNQDTLLIVKMYHYI